MLSRKNTVQLYKFIHDLDSELSEKIELASPNGPMVPQKWNSNIRISRYNLNYHVHI